MLKIIHYYLPCFSNPGSYLVQVLIITSLSYLFISFKLNILLFYYSCPNFSLCPPPPSPPPTPTVKPHPVVRVHGSFIHVP